MIDLSKYKILDSGAAVNGHAVTAIAGGLLQPHSYAVIAKDPAALSGSYPIYKAALAAKTSGDTISLKDDAGNIVDTTTFASTQGAAGDGNSLQKTETGWITATPTPGSTNNTTPAIPDTTQDNSNTTSTTTDTSVTTNTTNSIIVTTQSGTVSTHYSYLPLSTFNARQTFSVGAGRNRLGAVGIPIAFKAEIDEDGAAGATFNWTFGDGTTGSGDHLDHIYTHPGDYVVVLSAANDIHKAISRTQVKIIDPKLAISHASPEAIEISNLSTYEVNLYGWQLLSNGGSFLFPEDTIILPNQKLVLDASVTRLDPRSPQDVVLKNALAKTEFFVATSSPRIAKIDAQTLAILQGEALAVQSEINKLALATSQNAKKSSQVEPNNKSAYTTSIATSSTQVAAPVLAVYGMATTSVGASSSLPAKDSHWLQTLMHFFGVK